MNSKLFDLEHLQQLTYERSKTWASFLDNVAKNETLAEIDINNLEDIYGPECDEDDGDEELASMEDEESEEMLLDADVLRNVTNTTRFSLLFNNNKTLALPENATNEENNKLLDIFNQTMPIINEHHRQLKESGFEKILSTFDKQKIEDKVGSWLNRHNSLYGGDNTMLHHTLAQDKKKDYTKEYQMSSATRHGGRVGSRSCRNRGGTSSQNISHDSDDSLHSGETARYIRSSRAGAIRNAASTTTMIKTYRMVKSTRDALREKYACEKAEDEYHLKALRHRRKFVNELEYHHNHYDLARLQKSRKNERPLVPPPLPSSHLKERRKVLRKRNYSNSCSTMDSSSDSDYYNDEERRFHRKTHKAACCNQYHFTQRHNNYTPMTTLSKDVVKREIQRSAIKMPSARMNRMYYYTHSQTKSFSSSSSSSVSFNSICERRRAVKRNGKFYSDSRPCRRESECHCCNERKLCEEYKHVADTSTDEWYVENCVSPQKCLKTSTSHSKSSSKSNLEKVNEIPTTQKNNKTKAIKQPPPNDKPKQKSKTTKGKVNSKSANNISDETFDRELQMAIEASKALYEKEQEIKKNKETTNKKVPHEIIPTKPLRKTSRKVNNNQIEVKEQNQTTRKRQNTKNQSYDIDKEEDEIMEKLPKLIEENNKLIEDDDEQTFIKPKALPLKIQATKNNSIITTSTEETFFATQTQVICNSTALSSMSQAYNRQITDKMLSVEDDSNDKTNIKKSTNKTTKSKTEKSLKATKKKASSSTTEEKKVLSKTAAASTTVTSTTIRSPEINSTLSLGTSTKNITEAENDELSDCTLVTSTTNIEPPSVISMEEKLKENSQQDEATLNSNYQLTQKGILIYAPHNRSMAPAHSFTRDGYFTITKEHLSGVIGEKPAEKFLKYYIGRKRFNSNSTVYFRPPTATSLDGNNISSSSDSDDDLDNLGQYGDLYESLSNSAEITK